MSFDRSPHHAAPRRYEKAAVGAPRLQPQHEQRKARRRAISKHPPRAPLLALASIELDKVGP